MGEWDGFFADDDAAPPEPQRRYRQPEWVGPPDGTVGVAVALNLLLARNAVAAIVLPTVEVFRTGLLLRLAVLTAEALDDVDPQMFGPNPGVEATERFRFGVELGDGRRIFSGRHWKPEGGASRLSMRGGGGSPGRTVQELWLWPLPPAGTITFVAAWPAAGIAPAGVCVEAELILAAASESVVIFDEPPASPEPDALA